MTPLSFAGLSMSSRDRRTLIIGVATIVTLIAASRGIPAWYRWQQNVRDSARVAIAEAADGAAAMQAAPLVARMLAASERRSLGIAPAFLGGEHTATVSAALTSAVGDAATSSNVRVGTLQVQTDTSSSAGLLRVSVRGDAAGDITGIAHFLSAIESGVPLLAIRELTLTQTEPGGPADHPESLRIDFIIDAIAHASDGEPNADTHPDMRAKTPLGANTAFPQRVASAFIPILRDVAMYDDATLGTAADRVIANDPFRVERKPSRLAFGAPTGPPVAPHPRPPLVLTGTVGGPPWHAVLTGIPGHDGSTVVSVGDTVGGLRIRAVRRDTVMVSGADTSWTLTTKH